MPTSQPPIRVLCVDDHRIVREGIALILSREPDIEVVARAASGEEAVMMFRRHRPDITLMDLRLKAMSGLEAICAIRSDDPGARIIVLTMYVGDEDIHQALAAGATASPERSSARRTGAHGARRPRRGAFVV